jgi:hypothetical protein
MLYQLLRLYGPDVEILVNFDPPRRLHSKCSCCYTYFIAIGGMVGRAAQYSDQLHVEARQNRGLSPTKGFFSYPQRPGRI